MGLLKINMDMHTLRADVPSQLTADSDLLTILAGMRQLASDSLHLVPALTAIEAQSRLQVNMRAGVLPAIGDTDPASAVGYVHFEVCVVVDDELTYDHRDPDGPISAFFDAVNGGMGGVFASLPDPNGFLESLGIDGFDDAPAHIKIGSEVILFG